MKAGSEVEAQDSQGLTPLHCAAAIMGHLNNVVRELMQHPEIEDVDVVRADTAPWDRRRWR